MCCSLFSWLIVWFCSFTVSLTWRRDSSSWLFFSSSCLTLTSNSTSTPCVMTSSVKNNDSLTMTSWQKILLNQLNIDVNRGKLGVTPELISGLPRFNPYSINLQRCETGNSIGQFARDFGLLIQKKSPNENSSKRNPNVSNLISLISYILQSENHC